MPLLCSILHLLVALSQMWVKMWRHYSTRVVTLFSDQNLGNESATVLPSNPKFQCLILDHLHSLHALLDTFPLCVHGCSALTCPHWAHKKANARVIVTELFLCLIEYVKKEKWQFVIKCETYCGAWFPCMYQRVKVYPGLGQSSKFIQCSTSLASQPSSQ